MKAKSVAIVSMVILCFSFGLPAHAEFRMWEDKSGNTVEAELVSSVCDKAVLRKQDGKTVTVPISKLSEKDQSHIAGKSNAAVDANDEPDGKNYYKLRFTFSSSSDHASINILPPWDSGLHVKERKIIKTKDTDIGPKIGNFRIILPGIEDSMGSETEVEYIVYVLANKNENLKLNITRGAIGDVKLIVSGFDSNKGKFKKLRTFSTSWAGDDGELYQIPLKTLQRCGCVKFNPPHGRPR